MTGMEFRISLAKLNMNYSDFARIIKVNKGTPGFWGRGICKMPYSAELVLNSMLAERGLSDAGTSGSNSSQSA